MQTWTHKSNFHLKYQLHKRKLFKIQENERKNEMYSSNNMCVVLI